MRVFLPVVFSIVIIGILSYVEIFLLRKLHKDWWRHRWVRALSYCVPAIGLSSLAVWAIGIVIADQTLTGVGANITAIILVAGIALMLSLPLSGLVHTFDTFLHKRKNRKLTPEEIDDSIDPQRRRLLKTAATAFPLLAISTGGAGISGSFGDPVVPTIPLSFPNLPPGLEGLRILHISDVHFGFYIGIPEFERMASLAAEQHPDIVLVTGDLCDDAEMYPDVLHAVSQIPTKYGIYASIGNHEYFRGIQKIVSAYDAGPIPLLRDSGTILRIKDSEIYLGGADDPRSLGMISGKFFLETIDKTMKDAPSNAFTILMTHRPEGFNRAAEIGIDLTLAGHTHGGQIGLAGRSIFEDVMPRKYMWGLYKANASILYTTAGAGHWFPYRLGCAAEMPIYVLRNKA